MSPNPPRGILLSRARDARGISLLVLALLFAIPAVGQAQASGVGTVKALSVVGVPSDEPTSGAIAPRFIEHPRDVATVAFVDAKFSVAYTGRPTPSVNWQFSPDGSSWNDVPGANTSVLVVRSPVVSHDGMKWRARLTAPGGKPIYSNAATLTVSKAPATIRFDGLMRSYDGEPQPVFVTTIPAGLKVKVTYQLDGKPVDVPVQPGTYDVTVEASGPNHFSTSTTEMLVAES